MGGIDPIAQRIRVLATLNGGKGSGNFGYKDKFKQDKTVIRIHATLNRTRLALTNPTVILNHYGPGPHKSGSRQK